MYRFCAGEIRRTIWLYFLDLVALLAGGGASFFAASSSSSGLLFLAPRLLSSFKQAIRKYIFCWSRSTFKEHMISGWEFRVESGALFTLTLLAIFSVAALDAARPFLGTGASLETWPVLKFVYFSDQLSFICGKKGKIMISIMMRR